MAMAGLDGGRLSIGACSVGAAQACFEIALQYVKVRQCTARFSCINLIEIRSIGKKTIQKGYC